MLKHNYVLIFIALTMSIVSASCLAKWQKPVGVMYTSWGEQVTPENSWTEYPRPQMERENWTNLNGLWQFATVDASKFAQTIVYDQDILVPFVMESPLSGIGERLPQGHVMWYQKRFEYAPNQQGRTLLNFEGVDYSCRVWVNGIHVGTHTGGNLPFSFDVTHAIKQGQNTIKLRVIDETDAADRYQLRGKQKVDNHSIWYTPSSGIWQTVWLEDVPNTYIESLRMQADMNGQFFLSAELGGADLSQYHIALELLLADKTVHKSMSTHSQMQITLDNVELWSVKSPTLYTVKVTLQDKAGNVLDEVQSYAGFRRLGKEKDEAGDWRFTLNGEQVFHWGPLDQGWWPDGLLNPPSDEAMVFDLQYLKAAGFNMVRKHKKVEPRRYYYHTDRLGLLVWQDHVSGGRGETDFSSSVEGEAEWPQWKRLESLSESWKPRPHYPVLYANRETDIVEAHWPDWAHAQFMLELKTMIDTLYNHPSVVLWTTFNERWGQHRTMEVGRWVEQYDPSRYLNIASGGNFFPIGDVADQHDYPNPSFPLDVPLYNDYVKVVGEFGGHGWQVEGHQWDTNKDIMVYGGTPKNNADFKQRYKNTIEMLADLKAKGIAAGVYTQTSDVEIELNGLMTYDRKYLKFTAQELKTIHQNAGLSK
ncbi:glycoside hydrolase family 2 protein [Glaciecola siphonariae]|uniref:Glycoside hydrolase family 2 protein n=1 Tax=Glaciecola siphonariae TaxID=521012 RepID=A0ABV9LSR9_9ALTE